MQRIIAGILALGTEKRLPFGQPESEDGLVTFLFASLSCSLARQAGSGLFWDLGHGAWRQLLASFHLIKQTNVWEIVAVSPASPHADNFRPVGNRQCRPKLEMKLRSEVATEAGAGAGAGPN